MNNAKTSFSSKIEIDAEQTGQMTWGDTAPHEMESHSLNTYDLIDVTSYITCILPNSQDYCFLHGQMHDWSSDKMNDFKVMDNIVL